MIVYRKMSKGMKAATHISIFVVKIEVNRQRSYSSQSVVENYFHLPSACPARILSPRLIENLKSDLEFPFSCKLETGAWKINTTVDPMLKAAICNHFPQIINDVSNKQAKANLDLF